MHRFPHHRRCHRSTLSSAITLLFHQAVAPKHVVALRQAAAVTAKALRQLFYKRLFKIAAHPDVPYFLAVTRTVPLARDHERHQQPRLRYQVTAQHSALGQHRQ